MLFVSLAFMFWKCFANSCACCSSACIAKLLCSCACLFVWIVYWLFVCCVLSIVQLVFACVVRLHYVFCDVFLFRFLVCKYVVVLFVWLFVCSFVVPVMCSLCLLVLCYVVSLF